MRHIRTKYEDYYVDEENLRQGKCKSYYEGGELERKGYYKDDKLNGECKWYWENGKILEEKFYKDGKLEGEYKRYYEDGRLEEEGYFKDGIEIKDPLEKFILMGKEK